MDNRNVFPKLKEMARKYTPEVVDKWWRESQRIFEEHPFVIIVKLKKRSLKQHDLSDEQFYEVYRLAVLEERLNWQKARLNEPPTDEEELLWIHLYMDAGITYEDTLNYLRIRIDNDSSTLCDEYEKAKEDGVFPTDMSFIECIDILFAPPKQNIRGEHPVRQVLDIASDRKPIRQIDEDLLLLKMTREGRINNLVKAYALGARTAIEREGWSYNLNYLNPEAQGIMADGRVDIGARTAVSGKFDEETGIHDNVVWDYKPTKPLYKLPRKAELPLDPEERARERLVQFCYLAGIDLDELTPRNQERVLEWFDLYDMGYAFSDKKGMAMKNAYGRRADSEKTARSRLFKKIRHLNAERKRK